MRYAECMSAYDPQDYPSVAVTVDLVVLTIRDDDLEVALQLWLRAGWADGRVDCACGGTRRSSCVVGRKWSWLMNHMDCPLNVRE